MDTGKDNSPEFKEAEISKVLQYRLLEWVRRSWVGRICVGLAVVCILLFAFFKALPEDTQKALLNAVFQPGGSPSGGVEPSEQLRSRTETLRFKGTEETKTQTILARPGWNVVPESISARNIGGESADKATIGRIETNSFTVQVRLDSSVRRLKKQGGWAAVEVKWNEVLPTTGSP